MKTMLRASALCLLLAASPAFSGVYADDLSRCLVEKTTLEDKTALVRWIFVAMSQHPSVATLTKVTPADVEGYNQVAANLFMKLLTETCEEQTRKAVKYEGSVAIQVSFQVFGQAAASELFADPSVTGVIAGLEKFLDAEKLKALAPN